MADDKWPFSIEDAKKFKDNTVWVEILTMLQERLRLYQIQIATAPVYNVHFPTEDGKVKTTYGVEAMQGAIMEIGFLVEAPDLIIEDLEAQRDENKEKEGENHA